MPADNGAAPFRRHDFRVRATYSISEREKVLDDYRSFFERLSAHYNKKLSAQAIADVVDDTFNSFSYWTEITDPLFRAVFKQRLDTHTLRNLTRCELGLPVRALHVRSFRVLDAFSQIVQHDPPDWITRELG